MEKRSAVGVAVALIFGVAAVVCTVLATRAAVHIKSGSDIVQVTGSARKVIQSDLIIWKGSISVRAADMASAYRGLKAAMDKTRAHLTSKGIKMDEFRELPITTRSLLEPLPKPAQPEPYEYGAPPETNVYRKIVAFELDQQFEVRSERVAAVDELARKATELLASGVNLQSMPPRYLYTKLGELKVQMLADAAKDARSRAEEIAKNGGCTLGAVRFARMGVMRITPAYTTTELDEYGTYDTTTMDKEITAIVSMGYSIR